MKGVLESDCLAVSIGREGHEVKWSGTEGVMNEVT